MSSAAGSAADLDRLEQIAQDLEAGLSKTFLARQMKRAIDLARALDLQESQQVLAANPRLGNPWHVLALQVCRCEVTVFCENRRFLARIEEEHAALGTIYDFVPGLADFLASLPEDRPLEFRSGQINLFFPEEDAFDAVCLFSVARGIRGFAHEVVLHNSLRGLREGGVLLAGFLEPEFSDPDRVQKAAAAGDYFLDRLPVERVAYDAYAPDGLLFRLREKSGRSLGFDIIARMSEDLASQGRGNLGRRIEQILQLAREIGVGKGSEILVVGGTPDMWAERVFAGLAGQIDIVLAEDLDLDEAKSEFSFFPGVAAVEGGLQLQTALRNPNNRIYAPDFLKSVAALKSFDLVCLTRLDDDLDAFLACLRALKPQGKLLLGFQHPGQCDLGRLEETAAGIGSPLEFERELQFGSLGGALLSRPAGG